jgi:hypothetical protein
MSKLILPIDLEEATKILLKKLPTRRMKDVVEKRFGLKGGKKKTLEAIGQEYKITRERVRQIEVDAMKHLSREEHLREVQPTLQVLEAHFRDHGGVLAGHHFFGMLPSRGTSAHAAILLTVSNSFTELPETADFHKRWTTDKKSAELAEEIILYSKDRLAEIGHPLPPEELQAIVAKHARELTQKELPIEVRDAYLASSKNIRQNSYGEWGLMSWPTISPRGVKDKAYLVLAKSGKPMHFREVAVAINTLGVPARTSWNKRKAHPQTVHNELIKDNRFVLVGRGLYALKEWGYEPGTVRDILVSIFKKGGKPLSKEEVIKMVLEKRFVKPPTILLNLQDRSLFRRVDDNYTLA